MWNNHIQIYELHVTVRNNHVHFIYLYMIVHFALLDQLI
jgi:hypothetical protein